MLRKKLNNMENFFRYYGNHLNAVKDADNIKICVNLLDRIIEDKYHEMFFNNHDKKWGEINLWCSDVPNNPGLREVHVTRPKAITQEEIDQERKEFKTLSSRQEQQRIQDIKYLYDILKKYILCWWD